MIERKFVSQNMKEFLVKDYLFKELSRVGLSDVALQRTPLGEKVIISASRPGLVVGKGGSNIARLTKELQMRFDLENPQIEIEEVKDPRGNAAITAEMIANSLERFGSARFKGVGHKAISSVIDSGSQGVEILISGKIPSSRAKTWRFYQGYLKKCGDVAVSGVEESKQTAKLKTGIVGIQVKIMPSNIILPDRIMIKDVPDVAIVQDVPVVGDEGVASVGEEKVEVKSEAVSEDKPVKKTAKKVVKKTVKKAVKKEKDADEK
ncbi:MAG: 30S ribosomal protein S3 [Candidatus Woesearchaeota archaeon]